MYPNLDNKTYLFQYQRALLEKLGLSNEYQVASSYPLSSIKIHIDLKRPILAMQDVPGGYHVVVISGYDIANNLVRVMDSALGTLANVPYSKFCKDYRGYVGSKFTLAAHFWK